MKKTISLILCFAMLLSTVAFSLPAFAIEIDFNVESAENFAPIVEEEVAEATESQADASLMAATIVPGLNLGTGTTSPITFEETGTKLYKTANISTVDAPEGHTSSKVGSMTVADENGEFYPQLYFTAFDYTALESDRPIKFEFDYLGKFGNIWPLDFSGKTGSLGGATSITEWAHFTKVIKKSATAVNNGFQWGKLRRDACLIDNAALTPYYKVTFKNYAGAVVYTEYVLPENGKYTIPDKSDLEYNADIYGGWAYNGELTNEVTLNYRDITFVLTPKEGIELGAPVVFTGYNGAVKDVDPRYPGAYYKFDEAINTATLSSDALGGVQYSYDEETTTLVIYPKAKSFKAGSTVNYEAIDTAVQTVSGKVVILPELSVSYAARIPNDGLNIVPHGNVEMGFNPYFENTSMGVISVSTKTTEDGKIYASGDAIANSKAWPQMLMNTVFEAGATYTFYGRVKELPTKAGAAGGPPQLMFVYTGGISGQVDQHPDPNQSSLHISALHDEGAMDEAGWRNVTRTFGVTGESAIAAMVGIYTNPVSNKAHGMAIDEYEIYRRTDVIYKANAGVDASSATVPAKTGAFRYGKGNTKQTATVTVAENLYTAADDKRKVDGWVSTTDKIVYHAGDVIDLHEVQLTESGEYVLEPYLVANEEAGYKFAKITFVSDGLSKGPGVVDTVYVNGDTINLADYYDVTVSDPAMRFNGWSTTGELKDIIYTYTVDADSSPLTLYPIVNYDFNFKIPANRIWTSNGSVAISYTADGALESKHKVGTSEDHHIYYTELDIPAGKVYGARFYLDNEYTFYEGKDHISSDIRYFETVPSLATLFYGLDKAGFAGGISVNPKLEGKFTDANGQDYASYICELSKHASWDGSKKFTSIRFDPADKAMDYKVYYVEIVGYEKAEETYVEVAGLTAPVLGEKPDTSAIASDCAKVDGVEWVGDLTSAGNFNENTAYTVNVKLNPADATKRFKEDLRVTIGGVEATVAPAADFSCMVASVTYPKTASYKYYRDEVLYIDGLDLPVAGKAPATEVASGSENAEVTGFKWLTNFSVHGLYEELTEYKAEVTLVPADTTRKFVEDVVVKAGDVEAEVEFSDDGVELIATFTFPATAAYEEYEDTVIEILGLDAPVTGETPDTTISQINECASDVSVKWITELTAGGAFKDGTEYTAEIKFVPANIEKRFKSDVTVKVGELDAVVAFDKDGYGITATVTFPATESYDGFAFDLETVPSAIELTANEAIQLEENVTVEASEGVDTTVIWSIVEGGAVAQITESGELTINKPGTIKVRAVSAYNLNLDFTKEIAITVADTVETVTVNFEGNVTTLPEAATIVKGGYLDAGEYLDVTSAIADMRFNGWTPTGKVADLSTGKILVDDEDGDGMMTVYAVVNADFNFAVPGNHTGWTYSGKVAKEGDFLHAYAPTSTDVILEKVGLNMTAVKYSTMVMYFDKNYNENGVDKEFTSSFGAEGLYFSRKGESANGNRLIKPSSSMEGDFFKLTFKLNHQYWNGIFDKLRFDLLNRKYEYSVRYIHFEDTPKFDGTAIDLATSFVKPEAGSVDSLAFTDNAGMAEVSSIEWVPALVDGRFVENTAYTAKVTLAPKTGAGRIFKTETTVAVGGEVVGSVYDETACTIAFELAYEPTDAYVAFEPSISGADLIMIDGKTRKYTLEGINDVPDKAVAWSVSDTSVATIDENGVLTVLKDGTVTITATPLYNPAKVVTFDVTADYYDFSIEINGVDTVHKDERVKQYGCKFTSDYDIYDKSVTWTVSDESVGTIDAETGKFAPLRDGEVTITATANYDGVTKAEKTITVTNQAVEGLVVYNANTQDAGSVLDMPSSHGGKGLTALTTETPRRDGFAFNGWALSDETLETVTEVNVPSGETVTVYATWTKIFHSLEFNGSLDGLKPNQTTGATFTPYDTYLEVKSTTYGDIRTEYTLPKPLDTSKARYVEVRMATEPRTNIELYLNTLAATHAATMLSVGSGGLDKWVTARFDMHTNSNYKNATELKKFWFDPLNGQNTTVYIDYLRFLDMERNISFDANTDDEVEDMPAPKKVAQGEVLNIAAPSREGYTFLGWAKVAEPDAEDVIKNSYLITDDTTFYAIWAELISADADNNKVATVGEITEEALLVKTNKGATVTLTYTNDAGEEEKVTAEANALGYAVIDLRDIECDITDAVISTSGATLSSVSPAPFAIADKVANTVNTPASSGGSSDGNKEYDKTTTTLTKPGEITPSTNEEEVEVAASVTNDMLSDETILFNFENDYEKEFFGTLRQFTMSGMEESVIKFTCKGKASGSSDAPALFTKAFTLNADTHKYVVLKVRNTGFTSNNIRLYFQEKGGKFAEAKAITLTASNEEFVMLAYDMSTIPEWAGTIQSLFFAFGTEKDATVELDWIMFTNEVPEDIDAIEGTNELFPVVNKGTIPFADVKEDDWFYSEVNTAYKLGFVKGMTDTSYEPNGTVTVAEAITLAVRLNYLYNEKEVPEAAEGAEWYAPFVDAAIRNGIIKSEQFAEYNVPALRKEVAMIMHKALPAKFVNTINMFRSIPDLNKKDVAYGAVLKLYNAGIVIGSDDAHNFYPETNVKRSEIAAIVNRLAVPANRIRVITEEELESRRTYYYAADMSGVTLGNCHNTKLTIKNGLATATGKTKDPIVYLTNLVGQLDGKNITKITVGLKWDTTKLANASPVIFFTTPTGGWAAERMIKSTKGATDANGITAFTFDSKANSQFANTITGIRFDPFDAQDVEFSLSYVIIE